VKLGCSSSSYRAAFADSRMDLREWLRICAEDLELDGVELDDVDFASTDAAYLREIKKLCVDLCLNVSGIAVTSDFGPDDTRVAESARVRHWCDVAALLGAPAVRVFAGWVPVKRTDVQTGRIIGAFRRMFGEPPANVRRIWSDVTWALRQCADHAAERGVVLALQNQRGSLGSTPTQLAQLARDVGSPWLRFCLDPADFATTSGIDVLLTPTVQVHARMRNVRQDGSDSAAPWPELLRLLLIGHYRGFVHIDYHGAEAPESAVPRAAVHLRGLLHLLDRQQLLRSPSPESAPVSQNGAAAEHPPESAIDVVRGAFEAEVSARR
jgi:sugar phosphate isomerase/epimerase